MPPETKDSEIRARVTPEIFAGLSSIAQGRGEQLPVIVREALSEYLARRLAGSGGAAPERETLLQVLQEKPEVVSALASLARAMRSSEPVSYRAGRKSSSVAKKDTVRTVQDTAQRELARLKPAAAPPKSAR